MTKNNWQFKILETFSDSVLFACLVDEIMIALLDAGERETVFIACGVLINLMIDEHIKPKLKEEDGIKK